MALTIERLRPGGNEDMRAIKVSAKSYYLSPDGLKVYARGDSKMPPGCRLLVREGSPVDPAVADKYGIEMRDAQDVNRVPRGATTAPEDRGLGVSPQAEAGYARIDATAAVHERTADLARNAPRSGAGASTQVAMLREAEVNREVAEAVADNPEGARHLATLSGQQIGLASSAGDPNITEQLERGEREALARHRAQIAAAEETAKEEIKGGGTDGATASAVDPSANPSTPSSPSDTGSADTSGAASATSAPSTRTVDVDPGEANKGASKTRRASTKRASKKSSGA